MYARAWERGKKLPAHGLAWYAWLATKSGRRFCWESKRSVQNWTSLEVVDPDELTLDQILALCDELLAADWRDRWPVADQAAFRLDWSEFVARCTSQDAKAMALLAVGHRRCEAAELLGVSPAWMTTHMNQAHRAWEDFISE